MAIKEKDMQAAREVLESLPEDAQQSLLEIALTSDDPNELIRRVRVGDCPVCGSKNTRDCEDTPLDDSTVGICLPKMARWGGRLASFEYFGFIDDWFSLRVNLQRKRRGPWQ